MYIVVSRRISNGRKKKHKVVIELEVVLLCMIIAILGTNVASSNPPSNGVSYNKK